MKVAVSGEAAAKKDKGKGKSIFRAAQGNCFQGHNPKLREEADRKRNFRVWPMGWEEGRIKGRGGSILEVSSLGLQSGTAEPPQCPEDTAIT